LLVDLSHEGDRVGLLSILHLRVVRRTVEDSSSWRVPQGGDDCAIEGLWGDLKATRSTIIAILIRVNDDAWVYHRRDDSLMLADEDRQVANLFLSLRVASASYREHDIFGIFWLQGEWLSLLRYWCPLMIPSPPGSRYHNRRLGLFERGLTVNLHELEILIVSPTTDCPLLLKFSSPALCFIWHLMYCRKH
jgi:hypothetical protein